MYMHMNERSVESREKVAIHLWYGACAERNI